MSALFHKVGNGRPAMYAANLLVSFHYFLVVYINSTFLASRLSTEQLSLLYIAGSILSVAAFSFFARVVRRIGNYHFVVGLILLEAIALLGMGFGEHLGIIIGAFLLYLTVSPVIYLNLDIFLERSMDTEGATGSVRGTFLTMQNITQVLSPFMVGLLLVQNEYWRVYAASLIFLAAALAVIVAYLRAFNDARYHPRTLWQSAAYVFKHPALYDVVVAQFLLRFFYAWMVVYMPLYLSKDIGFSWAQIGVMFAIMLLPFLLLELPLGRLTDRKLPERTLMLVGFVLMAGAVACVPFLTVPAFGLWTALLFVSRIGASCTEIATESYFFRHVDGTLADTISLFRVARPATYIAAAVVAALALQALTLQWSFLILAACMLWGVRYALALKTA